MVFKSNVSMMYLFIANFLNFTLNVSFVMSQSLSRYDKKGKPLSITPFCIWYYKLLDTKIRQIYEFTQKHFSHKCPSDIDLGQVEILHTLKNIKTIDEGCAIKCTAACESHAGKLIMSFQTILITKSHIIIQTFISESNYHFYLVAT